MPRPFLAEANTRQDTQLFVDQREEAVEHVAPACALQVVEDAGDLALGLG